MLKLEHLSKYYYNKGMITSGLNNINLQFACGEFVAITGESGSGKSTLLNVIAGLDSYEDGEMYVEGKETSHFSQRDLENYRKSYIGNIFQNFNLVNSYTVYRNIELALLLNKYDEDTVEAKILEIIEKVGLSQFKNTKVSKLSGGQKQRVAIARVLVRETPILLADEPTGNLDAQSAQEILKLLSEIAENKLVIIVTHEYSNIEQYVTRKIVMSDGNVLEDVKIKPVEIIKDVVAENPSNITLVNKWKLGTSNAFNLVVKFGLLLLVFLILVSGVLAQYASYKYKGVVQGEMGYNNFFLDQSPERLVVNRIDREQFTPEELGKIAAITGVEKLVENDMILDLNAQVNTASFMWFQGNLRSTSQIKVPIDYGRMPETDDEIVVTAFKWESAVDNVDDVLGQEVEFNIWQFGGSQFSGLKIVGLIVIDNYSDNAIYISDTHMVELGSKVNHSVSKIRTTLNSQFLVNEYGGGYFGVSASDRVPAGQIYVSSDMNGYCKNSSCKNRAIIIDISNLYYEDSFSGKIGGVVKVNNLRSYFNLGINWQDYTMTFFMNTEDYNRLFRKPSYQISVFVNDTKNLESVISELESSGYKTLRIKDTLFNFYGGYNIVETIFNTILFAFVIIMLFFISYFVIWLVLRSRQAYYAVVRILGGSKGVVNELVAIELFTVYCIAFAVVAVLVMAINLDLIKYGGANASIQYISGIDYAILFGIVTVMVLWIAHRVSKSLFVKSAAQTYREGVRQ